MRYNTQERRSGGLLVQSYVNGFPNDSEIPYYVYTLREMLIVYALLIIVVHL